MRWPPDYLEVARDARLSGNDESAAALYALAEVDFAYVRRTTRAVANRFGVPGDRWRTSLTPRDRMAWLEMLNADLEAGRFMLPTVEWSREYLGEWLDPG